MTNAGLLGFRVRLINSLYSAGHLSSTDIQKRIEPGHGSCCTCQECGRCHDECVCRDNEIIKLIVEEFAHTMRSNENEA